MAAMSDSEEEGGGRKKPKFTFAPSIIMGASRAFDETAAFHKDLPKDLPPEELACLLEAPAAAAPTLPSFAAGGAGGGVALDLAAVTSELAAAAEGMGARAADAAWDFSGLAASAASERAAIEAEAEARQRAFESRLTALAEEDKPLMHERMSKADLSHKQRVRKLTSSLRGGDFSSKLAVKSATANARRRARNQARHS